jgi:chaperone required for assembly of F1-ATPase
VSVVPTQDGEFAITLDKRRLKSPFGRPVQVPSEDLARLIAAEWDAQPEHLETATMHLSSLSNTAIDHPTQLSKG